MYENKQTNKQTNKQILVFVSVSFFILSLIGCTDNHPLPLQSTNNAIQPLTQEQMKLQIDARQLSQLLAYDLNRNEQHRQEVFGRIANKFDGDFNTLLSHLSDNSIAEIQRVATSNSFAKSSGVTVSETFVTDMVAKYPKLQLMMPFADRWTDEKIQQAGGLIVAYYPFGIDDQKVKEITGYDRNGNTVTITRETAPTIPYVIINMNERIDDGGYLKSGRQIQTKDGIVIEKRKSIYGLDPKNIPFTSKQNWKSSNLNTLSTKNPMKVLQAMSEDGGGDPPPPANARLILGHFEQTNSSAWGGGAYLEGDPEFYTVVSTHPDRGGIQTVYISNAWLQNRVIYQANSYSLGYDNYINLRVMEEDGGALGPDDFIDDHWQYGLDQGGTIYYNITPTGSDSWFTGSPRNCVLSLYWN